MSFLAAFGRMKGPVRDEVCGMHSRWFSTGVVTFWLATMSWLVTQKVLPPLLVGEPPSYQQIIEAQKSAPPVGWRMSLRGWPLGWALCDTKPQPNGQTHIYGRVHFDALSLQELLPGVLNTLSRWIELPAGRLQMDARSRLMIDGLGRLMRFDSAVQVGPLGEVIWVCGAVEGRQLQLVVRARGMSIANEAYLPSDALLSDALSPQTQLPGLRAGQSWTVPVYSPLWPAKNPLDIVYATVKCLEPISWNGGMEDCWLVVYSSDPGGRTGGSESIRGKLWVRCDGAVLRQQVLWFDTVITFDRLPDGEALKLAHSAGDQWWNMERDLRGTLHD
jgi:hypothetical protein